MDEERKVGLRFLSDPFLIRDAAKSTMDKDIAVPDALGMSDALFRKYILSEYEFIDLLRLEVKMQNVLASTSVHFAQGAHTRPFFSVALAKSPKRIKTENGESGPHVFEIKTRELIGLMRKQLCKKNDEDTLKWALSIKNTFIRHGGYFKVIGELLVPNCIYRGQCFEFTPCGRYQRFGMVDALERYKIFNEDVERGKF